MTAGVKVCTRCQQPKSTALYLPRARICEPCRAADDAPRATEAEWQQTVTGALSAFGWDWTHIRRTRGKGGKWTTATSRPGWPDLVALRGGMILGIELKSETGRPTGDQLVWLGKFSRLVGGRAWIVTPRDPDWDTFVGWLRDPVNAPRKHGW